jgi:hypothetical protein
MVFEFAAASGHDDLAFLPVRGFHVDPFTADVLAERELAVTTVSRATTAATVMKVTEQFVFNRALEVSHLLALETLTGDAARASIGGEVKGVELFPSGYMLPPASPAKVGTRLDVQLDSGDIFAPEFLYTSAGGAGTATLALSFIGCRRHG